MQDKLMVIHLLLLALALAMCDGMPVTIVSWCADGARRGGLPLPMASAFRIVAV
jgi:hypothetical protein